MSAAAREVASRKITEKVVGSALFRRASYVGCYLSTDEEVNTWEIISRAWRMKKRVFVPVIGKNRGMQFREVTANTDLYRNHFGLLEPQQGELATARMLDIVITPVVAFDDDGHRVGMGGGYFDSTFAFLKHRNSWLHPKLVGVAFACQKVKKITPNPWDIRLFCAITEDD